MIKIKYLKVRGNISKYSLKKNILQNSIVHKKISLFNPNKNITINKFQNRLEQRIFDEDRAFVMLNRIFSKTEYLSTPTKYIEIDKNIIVKKDKLITQLKTKVIKEQHLKEKFININKSFVRNKEIIKNSAVGLVSPNKKIEVDKNIIVEKDKLITQLKTNIIKEQKLKLQDRFTTINKSFILNRDIIKNKMYNKFGDTKPTVIQYNIIKELQNSMVDLVSANKKIEIDKNIIVEKNKLITKLKSNIIKNSIDNIFTIDDRLSHTKNKKIVNNVDNNKDSIIGFVKIPKRKKVTKIENQVLTDNIKYIKKEEKVVDEQFLAPIIEKSVTNKIINIESIIENKFNVELDNFALDIDKLATRIFNELKEELDIGYRV